MTIWADDVMGRQGIARFLTKYLDASDSVRVLNVNAEWGAGKTFFLERWSKEIAASRACVYFNAWERDYTGDPFVSLAGAIHEQLGAQLSKTDQAAQGLKSFGKYAAKAIAAAGPKILKSLFSKHVADSDELAAVIVDATVDSVERAVEAAILACESAEKDVRTFKELFTQLASLAASERAAASAVDEAPVYIFIDELDRCRPTYAIELLERIKHFFDIPGCRFIIATDTVQLAHSIRAVYGQGFDSFQYLKRFFDAEYTLDSSDYSSWIKANCPLSGEGQLPIHTTRPVPTVSDRFNNTVAPDDKALFISGMNPNGVLFVAIAKTFRISLRQLKRCYQQVKSIQSNLNSPEFDIFWCAYLVVLRESAPDAFSSIIKGQDEAAVWRKLAEQYPPAVVYAGQANWYVHSLAREYFNFMSMNERSIAVRLGDINDTLLATVGHRFTNGRQPVMRQYVTFVQLAHSLS